MGLFQQRPEEPTEWGGLPAEPWEPRDTTEVLAPGAATFDLPLFGEIPHRETIAYTIHAVDIEPEAAGDDAVAADDAD